MTCTSVLALAISPHAWMYDAAIALPALFYAMRYLVEPWRSRVVISAYVLAAAWMPIVWLTRFNPLAIIVLAGAALTLASLLRTKQTSFQPAL